MFMIYQTGQKPVDRDSVLIDGVLGIDLSREEIERRLRAKGVPGIVGGQGRDSMLLAYARFLELDHSTHGVTP